MRQLTATLIGDGRSDRALIPLIQLVLDDLSPIPYSIQFADDLDENKLDQRILRAVELYPCDVLFIHRDSENQSYRLRETEIERAANAIKKTQSIIKVIPVRMTESWLLPHEHAIRRAASNPHGKVLLALPPNKKIENLVDPKEALFQAIRIASELPTQRRNKLNVHHARHRVSELLTEDDLTNLRQLPSFQHFELQVQHYFKSLDRA